MKPHHTTIDTTKIKEKEINTPILGPRVKNSGCHGEVREFQRCTLPSAMYRKLIGKEVQTKSVAIEFSVPIHLLTVENCHDHPPAAMAQPEEPWRSVLFAEMGERWH
jgi:hypothetical protein